ncbi:hypothetical protein E4U42_004203 [Claviceps africana]|uniref:Uncharacterized protein n=1 Tax=Claviceps africana TaxID=83212 RepID=A0A8K0J5N3_9HYPO|nr:hypothetical protein E4U42_004203 [Claviceps africana]
MKTNSALVTTIAVLSLSTAAKGRNLVAAQPRATGTAPVPEHGASPKPTQPPGLDAFQQSLFKRAPMSQAPLTVMIAPDNTCGWVSARSASPYTCGGRRATCGLVLAQKTFSGIVMCFNDEAFNFHVGCIDRASYFSSAACDNSCHANAYIAKCTRIALPYCNTIAFPGGITDYWCNSISDSTAQTAETTWRGQSDHRSYSAFKQSSPKYFAGASFPTNAFKADPTNTGAVTGAGSPTNGNDSRSANKTLIGAIVGGVMGGVAVISLGLLALFLFLCLRRKKRRTTGVGTSSSNPPPTQPDVSSQNQNHEYHDSKINSPSSQQPYPPQQQYRHTTSPAQTGYYPPPSLSPSSPTASHANDPRTGQMTTSPTPPWTYSYVTPPSDHPPQKHPAAGLQPIPGQQQQPPTLGPSPPYGPVHEVPAQTSDNHRGQMHELA